MGATNRNEGVFRYHIYLKTAQPIGTKVCLVSHHKNLKLVLSVQI
jgi:hypothetical protein